MKVLGIDFETQDADSKTTRATEVGAVLYSYDPKIKPQFREIDRFNTLIWDESYPAQTDQIVELTGINDNMLREGGMQPHLAFASIIAFVMDADLIMAHKISFDKNVLVHNARRIGLEVPEKEWLCTLTNFPWSSRFTCKKLSHLAYEHGILVDPRTLHRADADVDLMMRLIGECYDFEQILAYSRTPWIYVKAEIVPPWTDGGLQSEYAKGLGFSWEQVRNVEEHKWPKKWVRRVKTEAEFEGLVEQARNFKSPFRVARIEGI